MHYTAVVSGYLIDGDARAAASRKARVRASMPRITPLRAVGAWRNWWNMSVEEQPTITARQTRVIGARGRMPAH